MERCTWNHPCVDFVNRAIIPQTPHQRQLCTEFREALGERNNIDLGKGPSLTPSPKQEPGLRNRLDQKIRHTVLHQRQESLQYRAVLL